jgi:hypothetical protein
MLVVFVTGLVSVALGQTATSGKAEVAKQPAPAQAKPAEGGSTTSGNKGGLVVAIDPTTKEIRQPTPDEMMMLSPPPAVTTGAQALATVPGPAGGVGLFLGDSGMSYAVVSKGPDGKLKFDCVENAKTAEDKVKGAPAPATTVKKEAANDK